jgi:transposase-like protein
MRSIAMAPEIEVMSKAKRRTFNAEYKLRIVQEEADACTEPGAVGELLRREGLYSSHLAEWRKQRDEGGLTALGAYSTHRDLWGRGIVIGAIGAS